MATSVGELLELLRDEARTAAAAVPTPDPRQRADAATALGHLGRALHRIAADGFAAGPGAREQRIRALADGCREIAGTAPPREARMAQLAAGTADSAAQLSARVDTYGQRWACCVALAETAAELTAVLPGGAVGPFADRAASLTRLAGAATQLAAQQPPARSDYALLDRPIPNPAALPSPDAEHQRGPALREAVAALLHATAPPGPLTVHEARLATLAAELLTHPGRRPPPIRGHAGDADTWRAVRAALRPFEDGAHGPAAFSTGRRPADQRGTDTAAVRAALAVHALLRTAGPHSDSWHPGLRLALDAAVQHLPQLAEHLLSAAGRWAMERSLLAYACDLPPREERSGQYLAGHRGAGLVRADGLDLRPVLDGLHNARLLAVAHAAHTSPAPDPDFPRRAWAAHDTAQHRPRMPAALAQARHDTYQQLHQASAVRGPGRGR